MAVLTKRAAFHWWCLAPCALVACGGRSQDQPATAGSASAAGYPSGAGAGSSTVGGMAEGGSVSGAAGSLTLIDNECDLAVASEAACRTKIGEAFVDFKLGAHQGRYTQGCSPKCGDRVGPSSGADLEHGAKRYISACELDAMVSLTFDHSTWPSQISICPDKNSADCAEYALSGWVVEPFAAGSTTFVGTAPAVNLADASDTAALELSYNVCP